MTKQFKALVAAVRHANYKFYQELVVSGISVFGEDYKDSCSQLADIDTWERMDMALWEVSKVGSLEALKEFEREYDHEQDGDLEEYAMCIEVLDLSVKASQPILDNQAREAAREFKLDYEMYADWCDSLVGEDFYVVPVSRSQYLDELRYLRSKGEL